GLVAEEVDAFVGEVELNVARGGLRDTPRPLERLMTGRHLRRCIHREVALVDQSLNELVEQLCELRLALFIAVAAKRLEHLRRELPALDEGVENSLTERLHRSVALVAEVPAVVRLL